MNEYYGGVDLFLKKFLLHLVFTIYVILNIDIQSYISKSMHNKKYLLKALLHKKEIRLCFVT